MKHIIKIFSILALMSFFTSCNDELNQEDPGSQTIDNYFLTQSDFTLALRGAYSGYYSLYNGDSNSWTLTPDIMSDNVIINPSGRRSAQSTYEWIIDASNSPSGAYFGAYRVISRVNQILSKIDNLQDGAFKDQIVAECLALRGAAHFDVARAYAMIPTQSASANSSLGIAYVDTFDPFAEVPRLSTVSETYTRILQDLNDAVNGMPASSMEDGRYTLPALYGLMSRVYLYQGDYAAAISAADMSIANGAAVCSAANYPQVWNDYVQDGVLLAIPITDQEGITLGVSYNQTTGGIFSEYVVDYAFYQTFLPNDIRLSSFIETSPYDGVTYNHVIKYNYYGAGTSATLGRVNGKYLRAAEVYLNKAEALLRSGGSATDALAALNAVRDNRYTGSHPDGETGAALLAAVMDERRKELAFESDRFFTLKRLGMDLNRSTYGERADGSGTPAAVQTIPSSDHRWQWPISQFELENNSAMVQNPGY